MIRNPKTFLRRLQAVPVFLLLMLPFGALGSDAVKSTATFTIDLRYDHVAGEGMTVSLDCPAADYRREAKLQAGGTAVFEVPVPSGGPLSCFVGAAAPPGGDIRLRGEGGSKPPGAAGDCRFDTVEAGHANFCQIRVGRSRTSLTVYKKWIGARSSEPDVEVRLDCNQAGRYPPRMINRDAAGGWELDVNRAEGVLCSVSETAREEFIADMSDCRDILIRPGSREECTMVNTKVVKMIDMLNRYGLVIMILVFLAAGMLAVRRMTP